MEISNPVALQYITNQGLASQLNTQNKQLPVKSERFSLGNKIPAPTENEQRLRSEVDKKNKQPANTGENSDNSSVEYTGSLVVSQENLPAITGNARNLANNSGNSQQQTQGQDPAIVFRQKDPISTPIQNYLEISNLNSMLSQPEIDIYV